MKDECAGTPIAECVCLRPKMYSILKADETFLPTPWTAGPRAGAFQRRPGARTSAQPGCG